MHCVHAINRRLLVLVLVLGDLVDARGIVVEEQSVGDDDGAINCRCCRREALPFEEQCSLSVNPRGTTLSTGRCVFMSRCRCQCVVSRRRQRLPRRLADYYRCVVVVPVVVVRVVRSLRRCHPLWLP